MQAGDLATWIGVIVAFFVGVGGAIVGVVGLVIAKGARADAQEANAIAREANDHAKAALVGDDVTWSLSWMHAGNAYLFNGGTDVATNIRGSVTVDGELVTFGPVKEVDNLGGISLTFDNVPVLLAAEEARKNDGKVENGYVLWEADHERNHRVSWRITWDTPLGRTMPTDVQTFEGQPILRGTRVPEI